MLISDGISVFAVALKNLTRRRSGATKDAAPLRRRARNTLS